MKFSMKFAAAVLLSGGLIWFPRPARALQTVTGNDLAVVKVSSRDLNRIALPSKILKVYTSKPLDVKVEGSEAYVKVPPTVDGPVELYLLTEGATYTLMLVSAPVPAETILIKAGPESIPAPESENYIREIKSLLRAVAGGRTPSGYDAVLIDQGAEECPVKECSLVAMRRYTGTRFIIHEYRLANPTKEPHTYDEGIFTRPGTRAVAIERHEVEPDGATRLFRIEEVAP
jgi:hypothetical protein